MNEEEVKNYAVILDIHFITAFVEARGRHEALVIVLEALDHLHTQGLSHIEYGVREHKVYELIDLDKGQ